MTPGGEGLAAILNDVEMAVAEARNGVYSEMTPLVPVVLDPPAIIDHVDMVDAKVLMVPMLAQPIDPDIYAQLQSGIDQLRNKGLTILGDLVSDADDEFVIEQTAELANAIGSVPVDSPEFMMKIKQWLITKSFDGVLVLGTMPGQSDEHTAMLVMDKFHTVVPISDRTVHDLLMVLNNNGYGQE